MEHQNRIRALREDHDLTQKQAAEIFFMQLTQYRRYEVGERAVPLELACQMAEYYGVSLDYLAGRTDHDAAVVPRSMAPKEQLLVTRYRRLSETNKIRLLERLEALLEMEGKEQI